MSRVALAGKRVSKELLDKANKVSEEPQIHSRIGVSVVCPFFNEEGVIEQAIRTLLKKMESLETTWELIVVNDGSTDSSVDIVGKLCKEHPELKLVSYKFNRGRGYALRQGIAKSGGDVIITTEIDLSWGEDIVGRLYDAMKQHPEVDIVVASPHLSGGGYKNVPLKRVFISWFGNWVIRGCMSNTVTMNTGMTRAYRREAVQSLPLEEDGKEFHLEVIMKAQALKYRLFEIPSILEWKSYKLAGKRVNRKSSSIIKKLIVSHSLFSLFANPIRYVWGMSALTMLFSLTFLTWSIVRLLLDLVSVFTLMVSLSLAMISLILFMFGILAQQSVMIQKELWTVKRSLLHLIPGINEKENSSPRNRQVKY